MADLTPFATTDELAVYWRTLTESETTRAGVLLTLASNRLRLAAGNEGADLDTQAAESEAFKSVINWIVMEAVKRAMQTGSNPDMPSVESAQITAGPYSENYKYTNPTGDLFFRKSELAALGLSGKQILGSISPVTPEGYYGS